jgi:hypothetical protein
MEHFRDRITRKYPHLAGLPLHEIRENLAAVGRHRKRAAETTEEDVSVTPEGRAELLHGIPITLIVSDKERVEATIKKAKDGNYTVMVADGLFTPGKIEEYPYIVHNGTVRPNVDKIHRSMIDKLLPYAIEEPIYSIKVRDSGLSVTHLTRTDAPRSSSVVKLEPPGPQIGWQSGNRDPGGYQHPRSSEIEPPPEESEEETGFDFPIGG